MKNNNYKISNRPIINWSNFHISKRLCIESIEDLKYVQYTTSGRAAIYQALLQLNLAAGATVLVPSYHCPTMVAPVILANLKVSFYAIDDRGLPQLELIDDKIINISQAILVSHYFGIANSLQKVRAWCDENSIALIEDCAHCFYGKAGERSVGAWGDYATASLSKFFSVIEGGIVASNIRSINNINLKKYSIYTQLKSWIDLLEISTKNYGFLGLNTVLKLLFKVKFIFKIRDINKKSKLSEIDPWVNYCDMNRINKEMLLSSYLISKYSHSKFIIKKRKENYLYYEKIFTSIPGVHPLIKGTESTEKIVAPYVFPLWVDDASRVYNELKKLNIPVYRWDMVWPNTPIIETDKGPLWSQHVLQLLCHQNINKEQILSISNAIIRLI